MDNRAEIMKHDSLELTHTENLLKIILQKIGKKCKDGDFLKAREHLEKEDIKNTRLLRNYTSRK